MSTSVIINPSSSGISYGQFIVASITCQLYVNATAVIQLYDTNGNFIKNQTLVMPTDVYNNWLGNDDFFVNWICTTLGFTKA